MNPDIAQVCFLYGLIEALGYRNAKDDQPGSPRQIPEPEWRVDGNGVTLTLRVSDKVTTQPATSSLNLRLLSVAKELGPVKRLNYRTT